MTLAAATAARMRRKRRKKERDGRRPGLAWSDCRRGAPERRTKDGRWEGGFWRVGLVLQFLKSSFASPDALRCFASTKVLRCFVRVVSGVELA